MPILEDGYYEPFYLRFVQQRDELKAENERLKVEKKALLNQLIECRTLFSEKEEAVRGRILAEKENHQLRELIVSFVLMIKTLSQE